MSVKDYLLGVAVVRLLRRRTLSGKGTPAAAPPRAKPRPHDEIRALPRWKQVWRLCADAFSEWSADKAARLGAALSYYTVFALAPVLLIAISVAGLVFGPEAAQGHMIDELRAMFGPDTAKMVQEMLANSAGKGGSTLGTVIGIVTLLVGATAVMIELESALDTVWKVKPRPGRGIIGLIKDRVLSLGLVLSLGFLLLVSLVASAVLSALGSVLDRWSFPGAAVLSQILNNLVTLGVLTVFFALMYKYLPNTRAAWRDVLIGALVTSLLFHFGKIGIGLYLGRASVASTFGAAGSLAILLVWVYYTAQIVLYGAEVTRLYADRYGAGIRPDQDALPAPRAAECATGGTQAQPQPAG